MVFRFEYLLFTADSELDSTDAMFFTLSGWTLAGEEGVIMCDSADVSRSSVFGALWSP